MSVAASGIDSEIAVREENPIGVKYSIVARYTLISSKLLHNKYFYDSNNPFRGRERCRVMFICDMKTTFFCQAAPPPPVQFPSGRKRLTTVETINLFSASTC